MRPPSSGQGVSPLLLSLQYHHPQITLDLARATPTPNLDAKAPHDGASALFAAAGAGYLGVVRTLLALGANPDVQNAHGATALSHAALRGHTEVISVLLGHGADTKHGPGGSGDGALRAALSGGVLAGRTLTTVVDALLAAGANASAIGDDGRSLVHLAARLGESGAVKALLSSRADPNGRTSNDGRGLTPLMLAAAGGHERVVRTLVRGGAAVDARGGPQLHGATALFLAAQAKRVDAVRAPRE